MKPREPAPDEPAEPDGERLQELFDAALERAPGERARFLHESTRGEPELQASLEALLQHHAALDGFLAQPLGLAARIEQLLPAPPAAVPALLESGQTIGDYVIESLLGRGGGGQVFRARQRSLGGRPVALKVVSTLEITASDRERFLRGAEIAAEIHHPNMVEVYGCGEDRERALLYYSMRLVEGCTLQVVLDGLAWRREIPAPEVRRALVERFLELAQALAALHARGVIHQDVKPANILLEGGPRERPWEGRAVLVDYGLMRSLGGGRARSTVIATLPYAAPEVLLRGGGKPSADVYGLGMCLYDLLSGALPETRPEAGADLPALSRLVPEIEPDLEAIVDRAADPAPHRRYVDAGELAQDLRAYLAGDAVRARRLTRVERARRWLRRHPERVLRWGVRGVLYGSGVALAAIGILTLVDLWVRSRVVRGAWVAGDLLELEREARLLPDPFERWALSPELARALSSLETPERPLAQVVAAGRERGEPAALLLAARFVERDGYEARPELLRFLLHGLAVLHDAEQDRTAPERAALSTSPVMRVLALLFLERPAESAGELALVAPLRGALLRRLQAQESSDLDRMHVLAALGGCGDAATVPEIGRWLAGLGTDSGSDNEALRVGLRALDVIARRSGSCGYRDELVHLDWDGLLQEAGEVLHRVRTLSSPDYGTERALDGLATVVAYYRRRAGLPRLEFELGSLLDQVPAAFLGANGDPGFPSLLSQDRYLATLSGSSGEHFSAIGRALGLFGDPALTESVCGRLPLLEDPRDWTSSEALPALRQAVAVARDELDGIPKAWRPDEVSHLGAWLDRARSGWEVLRPPARELQPGKTIATWWFGHGDEPLLGGAATGLELRCTELVPEGRSEGFALLSAFGLSELRLLFRFDPQRENVLLLRLSYQKGCRWPLPYAGEANVELSFDGQMQSLVAGSTSAYVQLIPLSIRRSSPSGEYAVALRLDESSTTTFRVYSAEIVLQ
jgi:hypothetical protein